jgi:superfamily II DNA/RNA helicase
MRTKHHAKKLAQQLTAQGIPSVDLHGNLSQPARDRNLAAFASGAAKVLVATDVAARGVHVDDVELVIHVDPPMEHKAYLHRSGRTARAGAEGSVVTVVHARPGEGRQGPAAQGRHHGDAREGQCHLARGHPARRRGRPVRQPAPKVEQPRGGGRSQGANAQRKRAAREGGSGQGGGGRGAVRPLPAASPQGPVGSPRGRAVGSGGTGRAHRRAARAAPARDHGAAQGSGNPRTSGRRASHAGGAAGGKLMVGSVVRQNGASAAPVADPPGRARNSRSGVRPALGARRGLIERGAPPGGAPAQAPRMRSAARSPMTIAGRWCGRG